MKELPAKYLGDGAYVEFTEYDFVVYTSNGISRTNEVHLELSGAMQLQDFIQAIREGRRP
jgi:hypothetical protein